MFKKLLVTMLAVVMTVCLAISLSACVNFTSYDGHKHTYGSFEVTAPTETETGLAKATCSDCDEWDIGHVLTVELPVLTDKAYKTSYKVEPTCENTGVMQYAYTYKGFTVTFDVVVDELGHYWEWVPEVPATEEAAGMKAHFVCSGCGKFFDADFNEVSAEDLAIEFVPTYQAEEDTYYLVGKMKGESHWIPYTDDLKLTANEGNNGAIMNVELNAGDEIKVYKNGTYYPCAATEGVNTVVADGDGAGNGYILNDGTYNIYINTQDVVYIANANAAPQPDELGVITQDQTFIASADLVGEYTSATKIANGIRFVASADGKVTVDANGKTYGDDLKFTHRIKLGGTMSKDYRYFEVAVGGAATIEFYAMSSSSSADRALNMFTSLDDLTTPAQSQTAYGKTMDKQTYTVTDAGTYYFGSSNSGINVYAIIVKMGGTTPQGPEFKNGNENEFDNDGYWTYWYVAGADWNCGEVVNMKKAELAADGTITLTYQGGSVNYAVQVFYTNKELIKGKQYTMTCKVNVSAALTATINGKAYNLVAGDNNIEVDYTCTTYVNYDSIDDFDAQFNGSADEVTVKISDVKWEEYTPATYQVKADTYYLVGKMNGEEHWAPYTDDLILTANEGNNGAIMNVTLKAGDEIKVWKNNAYYPCAATEGVNTVVSEGEGAGNGYILNDGTYNIFINTSDVVYIAKAQTTPQGPEFKNGSENEFDNDGYWTYWYVAGADWNCGEVVNMKKAELAADGTITLTYQGGSVNYAVQVFYTNKELTKGKQYTMTCKVNVSAALTATINGKAYNLVAGDNNIEVDYTCTTYVNYDSIDDFDALFNGSADEVTVKISDVKWEEKTEPATPYVNLTLVEKYGDHYMHFTAETNYDISATNYVAVNGTQAWSEYTKNGNGTYTFKVYVGDLALETYVFDWYVDGNKVVSATYVQDVTPATYQAKADTYYLVGKMNGEAHWAPYTDDLILTANEGNNGAIMNVTLKAGDEIKVWKNGTYYPCAATEGVNTVVSEGEGAGNGYILNDGTYNIFINTSDVVYIAKVQTTPQGSEFKNGNENEFDNDGYWTYWYVAGADWGCGDVVNMKKAELAADGTITLTYQGGSVNYAVQVFYTNKELTKGKQYTMTCKVNVSAALSATINGKAYNLVAGDNNIEVDYTCTTYVNYDSIDDFDAQFNGSADEVTVKISDVKWEEYTPAYQAKADTYYLVGKMNGEEHWAPYTDDLILTANEGNNGAIMNVTLKAGDEIKVWKNGTYYPCAATEGVNTVVSDGDGAGNGHILNDGTYNIYINTQDVVYIAKAGAPADPDALSENTTIIFSEAKTISETTELAKGVKAVATSSNNITIESSSKTVDEVTYPNRFKFNGSMNADSRYIEFKVAGACTLKILALSGNGSIARNLCLFTSTTDKTVYTTSTIDVTGDAVLHTVYMYIAEAGTYYLGGPNGAINLYGIYVTMGAHNGMATTWSHDTGYHWHECADEACAGIKYSRTAHEWDEGVVKTPATTEAEGEMLYTCKVCGCTKIEPIEKISTEPDVVSESKKIIFTADNTSSSITSSYKVEKGVYAVGSSDKAMAGASKSATIEGTAYTYALSTGGGITATYGYVTVAVTGPCTIKVYFASNSSSTRTAGVFATANKNDAIGTAQTDKTGTVATANITAAGTYYVGSTSGAVNIFAIEIIYPATT